MTQHILPINDVKEHIEESTCECGPTLEILENGDMMFIHNSYDGRENKEKFSHPEVFSENGDQLFFDENANLIKIETMKEEDKSIQDTAYAIIDKFGNTEMGRYKIQLMCDEHSEKVLQKHKDEILNEDAIEDFVCKIWGLEVGKNHSDFTISVNSAINHIKSYLKKCYEEKGIN